MRSQGIKPDKKKVLPANAHKVQYIVLAIENLKRRINALPISYLILVYL